MQELRAATWQKEMRTYDFQLSSEASMKRIPPEKLALFLLPLPILLVVIGYGNSQKAYMETQDHKLADNLNDTERFIKLHSEPQPLTTARCNRVDADLLPIEL